MGNQPFLSFDNPEPSAKRLRVHHPSADDSNLLNPFREHYNNILDEHNVQLPRDHSHIRPQTEDFHHLLPSYDFPPLSQQHSNETGSSSQQSQHHLGMSYNFNDIHTTERINHLHHINQMDSNFENVTDPFRSNDDQNTSIPIQNLDQQQVFNEIDSSLQNIPEPSEMNYDTIDVNTEALPVMPDSNMENNLEDISQYLFDPSFGESSDLKYLSHPNINDTYNGYQSVIDAPHGQ